MNRDSITACLLGGALGDSLGLPSEGMNAGRIARRWPGKLRQRLIAGRGMVSDDTEHAVMTLLSLNESSDDADRFARQLAGRLRWWIASVPAGIGLATARSILKLWIGIPPSRSGVWSAGNGPLMRAPLIGTFHPNDVKTREKFVKSSTLLTHRDPRALESALMIAKAAAMATLAATDHEGILNRLERHVESAEMKTRFPLLRESLEAEETVSVFADKFTRKLGFVTGFAPDSASVAIYAWLRHRGDFRGTIASVVEAGGDTDTIAFIAGSIAGIDQGEHDLPQDWLDSLRDWPINERWLRRLGSGSSARYPIWPLALMRNVIFLTIVLVHGFRRLFPPY